MSRSAIRLQWDPDHHPSGAKLERRAIQLGFARSCLVVLAHSDQESVVVFRGDFARPKSDRGE